MFHEDSHPNPILVEVMRGGVKESFHRGVICVVNRKGDIIYSVGDVMQMCYPRSAMKFFQHLPLIESGAFDHFGFTLDELAVMCGSHNGEAKHVNTVRSILQKIGLDESYLHCGKQMPTLKEDMAALIREGQEPSAIHNNCSGKHAGFLAMAAYMKEDLKTYWKAEHPLQVWIKKAVAEMHEYPESEMVTALDGCSAPIFSIPVYHQAIAYKNLVNPMQFGDLRSRACRLIVTAVSKFPYMVAGKNRYCTDLMQQGGERVIGKTGAEGIFCLAFPEEGAAACIKIDDGKMLPQYNVAQQLVKQTGILNSEQLQPLESYIAAPLKNFNKYTTGDIRVHSDILSTPLHLNKSNN